MTKLIPIAILAAWSATASAQAPGESSAVTPSDCDRACLIGFAARYMDALAHHDPARVPLAADARFTENDVVLPVGHGGLWASISAVAATALTAADVETGNAAWMGTVEEHGVASYYGMRIAVRRGRITEIETVVQRKPGLPAPYGDAATLQHDPAFNEVLPEEERRGRERLRDVANGYFSTVSRNDGDVLTQFDPDCQRQENGVSTTRGNAGSAAIAQGCEAQFKLGIFRINKRVRDRHYPIIDEERGVVVATGFFDHDNSFDHYQTTDQKDHATLLKWPNSLSLIEAFKIRRGKIYRVEAIFTYVPYFMYSPWSAEVATHSSAATRTHTPSRSAAGCDRACLTGIATDYMSALAAHEPKRLPWGDPVRYSENSVPMMIGDGQWGSVTGTGPNPLLVCDAASGNVVWMGIVQEHGQPAYYAMRLKVAERRITEVEAVIRGKGESGPEGDATRYAPDPAFEAALNASERRDRAQLVHLADGYFSTLQRNDGTIRTQFDPQCARKENGATTTQGQAALAQGCESQFRLGKYRYDDEVRARRYEVVDVERGIVVATGFIDHGASFVRYRTTDGVERDTPYTAPNSLGFMEAFKIRNGRIFRIESFFSTVPFGMPSPWSEATPKPST